MSTEEKIKNKEIINTISDASEKADETVDAVSDEKTAETNSEAEVDKTPEKAAEAGQDEASETSVEAGQEEASETSVEAGQEEAPEKTAEAEQDEISETKENAEKEDGAEEASETDKDVEAEEKDTVEEDTETEEISKTNDETEAGKDGDAENEPYIDKSTLTAAQKKASRKKAGKICLVAFGIIVAAAIVAYMVVAVYFMYHYNRNTYIDGVDKSFSKVSTVSADIEHYMDNYSLTIITNDEKSYKLTGEDIGINIQVTYGAEDIKHDQNGLLWPFYLKNKKNYTIEYVITYDSQMLSDALSKLDFMQPENMTPGENAYVDIVDGASKVIEETEGTVIDTDALMSFLNDAIVSGEETVALHNTDCYVKADITADSEEIEHIKASADKILNTVISYYIDEVSWELTSETFGDWLYYRKGVWEISDYGIEQYVSDLASKYDTLGTDRTFVTYTGKTVTETGKKYGWKIDQETEITQISLILHSGISQAREPAMLQRGAAYTEKDDIGDTYVEVDLTNQHVYCIYEGQLVVDTDCVTGSVAAGHSTPDGLYSITYKASPAVLKGDDYESYVSYWMPFNGGIGLHDATWRSSFGGTIYQRSGSHGCVNMPLSKARDIYSYVSAGTPVICYY